MYRAPQVCSLVLLVALALPGAAAARTPGATPAATLLLPYFEVDPSGPEGMTTLFSVNNAGTDPVVAHVVLWTDWGVPTYSFDLALGANDVQTVNLRDLFASGSVPATDGSDIEGCGDPVAAPPLDATGLAALRARHAGRADPDDGLCYGSERPGETTWVGYVTADTARTCAGEATFFPGDQDYFLFDFTGVPLGQEPFVTDDNVLWGDLFYVAGEDDSAQGLELVHIPHDPEAPSGETFYRRFAGDGGDGRALLGSRYRGRYLDGGPFDGGTDLVVWLEGTRRGGPVECGTGDTPVDLCQAMDFRLFDEDGALLDRPVLGPTRLAFRLRVGSEELPAPAPFGFFELDHRVSPGCQTLPPPQPDEPMQAWVVPLMKAEGRFSVGLPATRIPVPAEP